MNDLEHLIYTIKDNKDVTVYIDLDQNKFIKYELDKLSFCESSLAHLKPTKFTINNLYFLSLDIIDEFTKLRNELMKLSLSNLSDSSIGVIGPLGETGNIKPIGAVQTMLNSKKELATQKPISISSNENILTDNNDFNFSWDIAMNYFKDGDYIRPHNIGTLSFATFETPMIVQKESGIALHTDIPYSIKIIIDNCPFKLVQTKNSYIYESSRLDTMPVTIKPEYQKDYDKVCNNDIIPLEVFNIPKYFYNELQVVKETHIICNYESEIYRFFLNSGLLQATYPDAYRYGSGDNKYKV